jgi:hypothetical protein
MKIVIIAPPNDNHTAPIKWALERAGFPVSCWAGLGWREERQASIHLNGDVVLRLGQERLVAGDVVWVRRPEPPLPNPSAAPEDAKFAAGEYRSFFHAVMYLLEALPLHVVNKYSASRYINNKSVQLLVAKECGMRIPATVVTNSAAAVRSHFARDDRRNICKGFVPHIWQKDPRNKIAVTETFELTREMLPDDEVFTFAPAIYQHMIEKRFDVRMVLLGNAVYSYALHNPKMALDWRQDAGQGLVEVEAIETPAHVEQAVLAFACRAGIAYGSFDFAVDAANEWWFLEVNEGGQFLWLDDFNAGLRVQEKFLAFLTSPLQSTRVEIEARQSLFPSWRDYLASPARGQEIPEQADPNASFVSVEP